MGFLLYWCDGLDTWQVYVASLCVSLNRPLGRFNLLVARSVENHVLYNIEYIFERLISPIYVG